MKTQSTIEKIVNQQLVTAVSRMKYCVRIQIPLVLQPGYYLRTPSQGVVDHHTIF